MNVKGLQRLIKEGLPVMRNTFLFRAISEIPAGHMYAYGDEERWAMRGFDDRQTINDSPYDLKEARALAFSRKQLAEVFAVINNELAERNVSPFNRLFFVCEVFTDNDVAFSGIVQKDRYDMVIDLQDANRPSRKDWTPDFSYQIPILEGEKLRFSDLAGKPHREEIIRISQDMLCLPEGAYADFVKVKDGCFFYHDLVIRSLQKS